MKLMYTIMRLMRVGEVLRRVLLALVVPLAAIAVFVFFMGNFAGFSDTVLLAWGIAAVAGMVIGLLFLSRRGDYHGAGLFLLFLNVLLGLLMNIVPGAVGQLLLVLMVLCNGIFIKLFAGQDFDPDVATAEDSPAVFPYVFWRQGLREMAEKGKSEEMRLAALMRLRLPADKDVISAQLGSFEEYANYDLAYGWPHVHYFERDGESTRTGSDGSILVTERFCCSCGVAKLKTSREEVEVKTGVCPNCGGVVGPYEEQMWMGGHFTWAEWYACAGCGREDEVDFSGEYRTRRLVPLFTRYE